jgi:membrane protease YdiL (CAAX protease family)
METAMKRRWLLYTLSLLVALAIDSVIALYGVGLQDHILHLLAYFFDEDSIYRNERFANSLVRITLAVAVSCGILLPALIFSKKQRTHILGYFRMRIVPTIIMLAIFFYLNAESENKSRYLYAAISFISIILVIAREHVLFFSQEWFSSNASDILIAGAIGLFVFAMLHPLHISEGRVLGTLLMVNLWIYTISERNLWMGVSLHAAWNLVLPESAMFHYSIVAISCFLAYGRPFYPVCLQGFGRYIPGPIKAFWSIPRTISNHFSSYVRGAR